MANMNAIDVSLYQTIYDANALKQDGIKLCMIKASQGRYLNGYGSFFKDRKMYLMWRLTARTIITRHCCARTERS